VLVVGSGAADEQAGEAAAADQGELGVHGVASPRSDWIGKGLGCGQR
jgi:hypothetical protein